MYGKDFGECPLVTPSSQIVGTQAVMNVVGGERYKMVTKESKVVLSGSYGSDRQALQSGGSEEVHR